jgi:carboxyl-terminal processing protease
MTRLNIHILWVVFLISAACYYKTVRDPYSRSFIFALDTIHERGLKPIDRDTLFSAAMSGMAQTHDSYSTFISQSESERFLQVLDQRLSGIGVGVEKDSSSGEILVVNTMIGVPHPAYDAGMRTDDKIVSVAGEAVAGKSLSEITSLIRGERNTPISITVIHKGEKEPETLKIMRRDIAIDSVLGDVHKTDGSWNYTLASNPHIAYFQITDFGDRTEKELSRALKILQRDGTVAGAIVDVRDNVGGYLSAATGVCDLFLNDGTIVTTHGRGGQFQESYSATRNGTHEGFPLVVLINDQSASASEIFAACMQDHARATIVGMQSYGKGSVQTMIPFANGSLLKLTTATYHRPSGKNIDRQRGSTEKEDWGVHPTEGMEVTMTKEAQKVRRTARAKRNAFRPEADDEKLQTAPEVDDPQLKKAIEHLREILGAK